MKLTVLGCGDAFGSGGRLQTSYHLEADGRRLLIDCGATSLIGMERAGLDTDDVDAIIISHLHGDHFSGLVWWLLHAQHVAKRQKDLLVAGPPGIEARFRAATEALFPGALGANCRFELRFMEQAAGKLQNVAGFGILPFEVSHPAGSVSHALRLERAGQTLAFSGDTEWVEALVPCAQSTDLFLCECYAFDQPVRYHMNWQQLSRELPRIGARKVVLTHMSGEMLSAVGKGLVSGVGIAQDGMVIEV